MRNIGAPLQPSSSPEPHRLKLAVPSLALQPALLLDGRQLAGRRPDLQLTIHVCLAALQGSLQQCQGGSTRGNRLTGMAGSEQPGPEGQPRKAMPLRQPGLLPTDSADVPVCLALPCLEVG